jgi:hypothetical protein
VELTPPARILQTVIFDSADGAFSGETTMIVTFEKREGGTEVTLAFETSLRAFGPKTMTRGHVRRSRSWLATSSSSVAALAAADRWSRNGGFVSSGYEMLGIASPF